MFTIGMLMKVKPGCYPEYKKAHDELWPAIAKSMSDNQVSMQIFLYRDQLFLHAMAPTQADWDKSRQHPELVRWHDYMATLLQADESGKIIFEELEKAFTFGGFRD
ncbi:MAG: L-rhamnose mutarotase [Candidatus Latescibacteria bacterium]|nr:L-rhamnose mutarotase [Candidatus Latescibacterota bacterium]